MNKRRQIADANPKNLTHFSNNSMSSSAANITQSPINSSAINADFRPIKSIIIGAGQPIPIPGQRTSLINDTKSNPLKSNANVSMSKAEATIRTSLSIEPLPVRQLPNIDTNNVTSVEEFCPDGGTLDKGFLDDFPTITNADARKIDLNYDSDSDSNDTGNPLVAKFHDDPFDDMAISIQTHSTSSSTIDLLKPEPKVNPLAKNKNKSGIIPHDLGLVLTTTTRRNSNSSDDNEIPHILQTNTKPQIDHNNSDEQLNTDDFDSWLSDTNQRRSPEGGEDEASLPSIDKSNISSRQLERLEINDAVDDDTDKMEKTTKTKKKKKEKKDKKEKGEKSEKKRLKSKKSASETLLSERPSHSDRNSTEEDQYEAF